MHYWLRQAGGELVVVPRSQPSHGATGGLDAHGRVFLTVGGLHYGVQRVTRWDGQEFRDLDSREGFPSGVVAVAQTGWAAGFVEVSADVTRADRRQAARWGPDGQLQVAPNTHHGFDGTAVGIASDGTAVVLRMALGSTPRCALWRPDGGIEELPAVPQSDLLVVGISDQHRIAAASISANGRSTMIRGPETQWVPLGTPMGWEPTKVSPAGLIVGVLREEGFMQGWVTDADGDVDRLPGYRFHHCIPTAANGRGDVVGTASADHCSHALRWRRRQ